MQYSADALSTRAVHVAGGLAASRPAIENAESRSGPLSRRKATAIALLLVLAALGVGALSMGNGFGLLGRREVAVRILTVGRAGMHMNAVGAPAIAPAQVNQRLLGADARTDADLDVSMAWNSLSDLDLQVRDPSGEMIYAWHPRSKSGGQMDVDANPTVSMRNGVLVSDPTPADVLPLTETIVSNGGFYPLGERKHAFRDNEAVRSLYSHSPVEHIYFSNVPRGVYTVYAHCYLWREADKTLLPFTIQLRSRDGSLKELSGRMPPFDYVTHRTTPVEVCRFVVD